MGLSRFCAFYASGCCHNSVLHFCCSNTTSTWLSKLHAHVQQHSSWVTGALVACTAFVSRKLSDNADRRPATIPSRRSSSGCELQCTAFFQGFSPEVWGVVLFLQMEQHDLIFVCLLLCLCVSAQVPPGHVWLTGDNLILSRDSREYGPVPLALVKGRVVAQVRDSNSNLVISITCLMTADVS